MDDYNRVSSQKKSDFHARCDYFCITKKNDDSMDDDVYVFITKKIKI